MGNRRTVEAELLELGLSWGEAQLAANDSDRWKNIIDALCLKGGKGISKYKRHLGALDNRAKMRHDTVPL